MSQFTAEDIAFLESEAHNGLTATLDSSSAYVRNLDHNIKQQYERVYQSVVNPDFVLCYHCSTEVFSMVRRVHAVYKTFKAARKPAAELGEPVGEPIDFAANTPNEIPPVTIAETADGEPIVETIEVPAEKPKRSRAKAKPAIEPIVGEGDE